MIQIDKQELVNTVMQDKQLFRAYCNDTTFRAIYEVLLHHSPISEKALLELIQVVCDQNNDLLVRLSGVVSRLPLPVIHPPEGEEPTQDKNALPTSAELLVVYKLALKRAYSKKELRCPVLDIEAKIRKLESDTYEPTALDTVWVDYFLSHNPSDDPKLWEVFVDRMKSLLDRWDKYHMSHFEVKDPEIIHHCLAEINDEFTQHLLKRGKSEMEQFIEDNKDSYKEQM